MRGTLSHPSKVDGSPSFEHGRRRRTRVFGAGSLVLLLGLVLTGCGDQGPPVAMSSLAPAEPEEDEVVDFAWPQDPSHPVIEIEVQTPEQTGTILVELMPELAPTTVVNVIDLADEGYYDGTTFHRVIPGFMIQGGDPRSRDRDPTNDGTGGTDRPLPDEFTQAPYVRGVVGMGNRGRDDSTSAQFFIMQADNRNLDGRYNTIGRVLDGMHLVDDITKVAIDRSGRWGPKDRPIENIVIKRVRPVGQLAAIRAAMELEERGGEIALASEAVTAETAPRAEAIAGGESAAAPAAMATGGGE